MTLFVLFFPSIRLFWDPETLQNKGNANMTNRPCFTPPTPSPSLFPPLPWPFLRCSGKGGRGCCGGGALGARGGWRGMSLQRAVGARPTSGCTHMHLRQRVVSVSYDEATRHDPGRALQSTGMSYGAGKKGRKIPTCRVGGPLGSNG